MDWNQLKQAFGLSDQQLQEQLKICGIEAKDSYNEAEKEQLGNYLKLIAPDPQKLAQFKKLVDSDKKSASEAISIIIAAPTNPKKETRSKKSKKQSPAISLFDLMKAGQEKTGKPLTLAKGQEILAVTGLAETAAYEAEEAERFLQACELIINQGKSLAEVAQVNGVEIKGQQSPLEWARNNGANQTQTFDQLADQNAQLSEQVSEVYQQAYFASLQHYFDSGQYDRRYAEAQARIRQQRGPTAFEQFDQQFRLWQANQDPLARIGREILPADAQPVIEEGQSE